MGMQGVARTVQELVERYYEALFRYACRLTGTQSEAEDITQETFCKAQTHLSQLRDPERARPWLFAILRNAFLLRRRDERQAKELSLEEVAEPPCRNSDSVPMVDPAQLQAALQRLPEGFRTPVILYYFEDFSYRDIAEQMGLPIGTVMSRLSRAKAFLRRELVQEEMPAEGRHAHGL